MRPIIYILSDPADRKHEELLVKHLIPAARFANAITVRRANAVLAGEEAAEQRKSDIDQSQIVLLLVSPDFWASCYDLALRALAQKKRVVPVLVRDTMWRAAEFGGRQPLPQNGKPIADWSNPDNAWMDVVSGLKPLWESIAAQPSTASTLVPGTTPLHPARDAALSAPLALRREEKLKILFVTANGADTTRLMLGEEYHRIRERVLKATGRDQFEFIFEPEIRINELAGTLMRSKPHVVHFSGHGSQSGAIMLADPSNPGKSRAFDPLALRQMFTVLHDNLHCVVLNSCWSAANEQQALALADATGCVFGLTTTISDDAAIECAASFYEALAFGRSFQTAFEVARANLQALGQSESTSVRLYHRPNVDPSKLPFAG